MFLPIGSRDDFGDIVTNRYRVFEAFRHVITFRGYKEISTPVVEYANTFTNKYVEMKLQNMMKWFNPEGEIEVLRPDWTTAIARALVKGEITEQKWAYQGSIFRKDLPGVESRQAGVEIIHAPPLLGESECLLMARQFLSKLKIDDYLIELGHTTIYDKLTRDLQMTSEQEETLRQAMHDKRKDEVYQFVHDLGNKEMAKELSDLIDAYGTIEVLDEYEKRWQHHQTLYKTVKHMKQLAAILKQSGEQEILVDLGRVRNLPYYSGLMFRGFLKENGATCFSGGRYDQLYANYGQQTSAVGLAFFVDTLAEQLPAEAPFKKLCIIASHESIAYAEQLREHYADYIVDIVYEKPDKNYDLVLEIVKNNDRFEVTEK